MPLKLRLPPRKRQVIPPKFKRPAAPPRTVVDWRAAAKTSNVSSDDRIKLLVLTNPKKPGSAAAETFARYQDGMSVGEAMKAGIPAEALAHDRAAGFVSFHPLPDFMALMAAA